MLANLFTSPFYSSKSVLTHIVPVFTAGNAEWLFCDALKLAFQLPSLLLVLKNYCCVFLHTLTGIEWLESDFISRCFPMSKILRVYFLFFFFLQEKIKRIQQIRMEKELRAQQILEVQNLIQHYL